ncbi:hypothetical protein Tco_1171518, partial [Tanacetum coccineum]
LHQLDTFYNALNPTDQDSLNAAAGVSANTSSSTMTSPSEMAALTDVLNAMLHHVKTSPSETVKAISKTPTKGYGDAIVIPAILTKNFELKHGLLNLVTSKQFYGFEKEDPHAHIRWFNKITSTIKYKDVRNSSIKLMLFPHSMLLQPQQPIIRIKDIVIKETQIIVLAIKWDHLVFL